MRRVAVYGIASVLFALGLVLATFFLTVSVVGAPAITSNPDDVAQINRVYEYQVVANETVNITLSTDADWLILEDGVVKGIPSEEKIGYYWVNVTAENENGTTWQNYTLGVSDYTIIIGGETYLGLGICILFTLLAFMDKRILLFAGVTWIVCSLIVFGEYGAFFLVLTLGFGMFLLMDGVFEYVPN